MNQLKIEIGDTVKIAEGSRYYRHSGDGEGVVNSTTIGSLTIKVKWDSGYSNYYDNSDLTLIKKGKTMQFTKSDLKTGMFVKQRDGMFMLVLEKAAVGSTCFTNLVDLKENLLAVNYTHLDIVAVYKAVYGGIVNEYMLGNELALIWERIEQTEAQKEMEVLQEQAKALQEQITKLQSKL
jgi:hypothetical protein